MVYGIDGNPLYLPVKIWEVHGKRPIKKFLKKVKKAISG